MTRLPEQLLAEADLFISYLTGDDLEPKFNKVVEKAKSNEVKLMTSSEVYDDVISALRSQEVRLEKVESFVSDMRTIPHEPLPVTGEVARMAIRIYLEHGGARKLHYFDSFHVATASQHNAPLLTSDKYVNQNHVELGIETVDARKL